MDSVSDLWQTDPVLAKAQAEADAFLARAIGGMSPEDMARAFGERFDVFAAACLRIRRKSGGALLPFLLNPIQRDYLRTMRGRYARTRGYDDFRGVRDLIVKPRQLGFSTFLAGIYFMLGIQNPGRNIVVLSHDKDISEILLETYRLYWEHMPPGLRHGLKLKADSKYAFEIVFPGDQSLRPPTKFTVDTEAGHPYRGGRITDLHSSEAAFYRDFPAYKASYVQGVGIDGNIVMETTVNGQNDYYREVMNSLNGVSGYRVVFYEWFRHPEYRLPWDPKKQAAITPEESEAMATFGLDLEQLAWRRWKAAELGELFPQEYPETLLGAFLSTGRPFFDQKAVTRGAEGAKAWAAKAEAKPRPFGPHGLIYEEPVKGRVYMLSADVAEGIEKVAPDPLDPERGGADFSAAYVIDTVTLRTVAKIHGRIPPTDYARELDIMGRYYNMACIAPERNNHGHTVVHILETGYYPNLYRHLEYDEAGNKYLKPGFPTDVKTRPMMLDALADTIRSGAHGCPDEGFWRECHTFARNPTTGKPEALKGAHDDRVMGKAIGVYLCTLGASAWGLPTVATADASGLPTGAVDASGVPVGIPEPPAAHPGSDVILPGGGDLLGMIREGKEQAKANTCGACMHCGEDLGEGDSRCAHFRFRIRRRDPACAAYYPAEQVPYGH